MKIITAYLRIIPIKTSLNYFKYIYCIFLIFYLFSDKPKKSIYNKNLFIKKNASPGNRTQTSRMGHLISTIKLKMRSCNFAKLSI